MEKKCERLHVYYLNVIKVARTHFIIIRRFIIIVCILQCSTVISEKWGLQHTWWFAVYTNFSFWNVSPHNEIYIKSDGNCIKEKIKVLNKVAGRRKQLLHNAYNILLQSAETRTYIYKSALFKNYLKIYLFPLN